jgi:hypothetical protein
MKPRLMCADNTLNAVTILIIPMLIRRSDEVFALDLKARRSIGDLGANVY